MSPSVECTYVNKHGGFPVITGQKTKRSLKKYGRFWITFNYSAPKSNQYLIYVYNTNFLLNREITKTKKVFNLVKSGRIYM